MRKTVVLLVAVLVATGAGAATVVLKGGKRLEVERFVQKGNYVIVQYPGGRMESYSLNAVDLNATRDANRGPETEEAPPAPRGPHSPFFDAQAVAGTSAVTITDSDVEHVNPDEEMEEGEGGGQQPDGTVALVSYDRRQVEDNLWEVAAVIGNNGSAPIQGLSASIRLMDRDGNTVGTGTGIAAGQVGSGQQTTVTARIRTEGEPFQVAFDFQWQTIRTAPRPAPMGAPAGLPPGAEPSATEEPPIPQYEVPPGADPNTLPSNPMAMPPLTEPPANTAPQVPRPTPEPPNQGQG